MYDYFQFMWEEDIVLMGLGTQAVYASLLIHALFTVGKNTFATTLHC